MKILQSYLFRAICSIAVGVLLVSNPDSTVKWITVVIGVMFLLSGAISIAAWLSSRSKSRGVDVYDSDGNIIVQSKPVFPIVGLGSVLLGLVLMLMPGEFVTSLMYVLGAIILLGAVNQFMTLVSLNKVMRVPVVMWVVPSLLLIAGVVVLVKPMESASLPLLITGWCLMVYGAMEFINAIAVFKGNRLKRAQAAKDDHTEDNEEKQPSGEERKE